MADYGAPISKDEADHLYRTQKQVVGEIQWFRRPDGYGDLTVELICVEDGTPMTVRGWCARKLTGVANRRYGFSLLYKNSIVIRRWDAKPGHRDPITQTIMKGAHKHFAHEDFADSGAYETADVRLDDPNAGLTDFLKECNVSLDNVRFQRQMEDYNG